MIFIIFIMLVEEDAPHSKFFQAWIGDAIQRRAYMHQLTQLVSDDV